ncbi:MAG: hypothetical protein VKM98_10880 [Cyanobacteriota bacterium]|nr:hypothetical protein [Cyanobacteriota bacterium]
MPAAQPSVRRQPQPSRRRRRAPERAPSQAARPLEAAAATPPRHAVFSADGQLIGVSSERQELLCSLIGLLVKCSLMTVVAVSLVRLAVAYQERMDRQGELSAVLEIEQAKLAKARERFDHLFSVGGEQRLIREQNQWIAPNRLRVVWTNPAAQPSEP